MRCSFRPRACGRISPPAYPSLHTYIHHTHLTAASTSSRRRSPSAARSSSLGTLSSCLGWTATRTPASSMVCIARRVCATYRWILMTPMVDFLLSHTLLMRSGGRWFPRDPLPPDPAGHWAAHCAAWFVAHRVKARHRRTRRARWPLHCNRVRISDDRH